MRYEGDVDYFENGDVALIVRQIGDGPVFWVKAGVAMIEFREKQWSELRELLTVFWQETDAEELGKAVGGV